MLVILIWTDHRRGQKKMTLDIEALDATKAALEDKVVHIHVWREQQANLPKGLVIENDKRPA